MEIVLNHYGSSLSQRNQNFLVQTEDGDRIVPVHGLTAIYVWKSTRISSDAMLLALENDVDLVLVDRIGNVRGRVWNCKFGSIASVRKGQLLFSATSPGLIWMKKTLQKKIKSQINLLMTLLKERESEIRPRKVVFIEESIDRMNLCISKIQNVSADCISKVADSLRGFEGTASRLYFHCVGFLMPKGIKFRKRQQKPARDIVNAMLNYAYGILYNKVENALLKAGIDPCIGLLHADGYNTPAFTFDCIEPYRHWADRIVFSMVLSDEVKESMGMWDAETGCYLLGDELRQLLAATLIEFLSESTTGYKSPLFQMQLDAQHLAQIFKMLLKKKDWYDGQTFDY
jgi:CRISPR-associated protein Cas1